MDRPLGTGECGSPGNYSEDITMKKFAFWESEDGSARYPGIEHCSFILNVPHGVSPIDLAVSIKRVNPNETGFYHYRDVTNVIKEIKNKVIN